jgi:hypothetical protein
MNKHLYAIALTTALCLAQTTMCVTAPVEFAKITSKITKNAEPWSQNVLHTLDTELQLAWANFFALILEEQPSKALIKCAEYIESHDEMITSSQELALSTIQILQEYSEKVEEKISRKKNMTDEEEETLFQKLETKIQELLAYINAIYYEHVYNNLVTKGSSAAYMFDDNGVIPQQERTRSLPQPK